MVVGRLLPYWEGPICRGYVKLWGGNKNFFMGVSKNNGTPKSSTFIGFSIINHPFGVPLFLETSISNLSPHLSARPVSMQAHSYRHRGLQKSPEIEVPDIFFFGMERSHHKIKTEVFWVPGIINGFPFKFFHSKLVESVITLLGCPWKLVTIVSKLVDFTYLRDL